MQTNSNSPQRFYFSQQYIPVKIQLPQEQAYSVGYIKDISASGACIVMAKNGAKNFYVDLLLDNDGHSLCHKVSMQPSQIKDSINLAVEQAVNLSMAPFRCKGLQLEAKVVHISQSKELCFYGVQFSSGKLSQVLAKEVAAAEKRTVKPSFNVMHSLAWLATSAILGVAWQQLAIF